MNSPDNHIERRARELYLEAGRRLDPNTAGRLRAARRTALEAAQAPRRSPARMLLPAGAFAAVALAALMVWQPLQRDEPAPMRTTAPMQTADLDGELPPDAESTDPRLYQNLEFYGWLAASHSRSGNR